MPLTNEPESLLDGLCDPWSFDGEDPSGEVDLERIGQLDSDAARAMHTGGIRMDGHDLMQTKHYYRTKRESSISLPI